MSCDTNGPIRKAYCHDDVTKNPKRLVPSLMGFVRVRVCARAGSQARGDRDFFCARVKNVFLGGFLIGKKRDTKNEIKCLKMKFIVMKSKMFTSYNRSKISTELIRNI